METRNNILNELLEISPFVAAISNRNVYAVPDGYFTGLAEEIAEEVKAESYLQKNKIVPFEVPAGYFDGLANNILLKINGKNEIFAELEEFAPLLNTIEKKNIYNVPSDYFEKFSIGIPVTKSNPAKVFNIAGKTRKLFMYAVAAAVAGILATGTFLYVNNNNNMPVKNKPAGNPYAALNNIDVNDRISKLSDAEIAGYLDTHASGNEIVVPPASDDDMDIQDFLNNASDEEIQQYLDNTKIPSEKSPKGI